MSESLPSQYEKTLSLAVLCLALPSCDSPAGDAPKISGDHQSTAIIQILATHHDRQSEKFVANEIASLSMGEVAKVASLGIPHISANTIQRSIKVERIAQSDLVQDNRKDLIILTSQVEQMKQITGDRRDDTIELSLKQDRSTQAVRTYEQSRTMFEDMKDQQQRARVALKMPHPPVISRQSTE